MDLCFTPQECALQVVDTVWSGLGDAVRDAAGQMITTLFGWWTTTPSLGVDTAVTLTAQRYVTAWVALPIAAVALIAVVGWGVLAAGDSWPRDVLRGLLVFGVVAAGAVPIVAALQSWSDALAGGLLSAVPFGDVGGRFEQILTNSATSPAAGIFWNGLIFLAGAAQYLLMLFRDGVVVLLTVLLPVAAAGQFARSSMLWLPKVGGWLLAFVFFKPAAALVYFVGLTFFGQAEGLQGLATAVCLLVAAMLALPALLRLVTFAVEAAPLHTNAMSTGATIAGVSASGAQLLARTGSAPAATGATGATGVVGVTGAAAAGPAAPAVAGIAAAGAISNAPAAVARSATPTGPTPTGPTPTTDPGPTGTRHGGTR